MYYTHFLEVQVRWIDAHCHPQLSAQEEQLCRLHSWKDHTLLACATGPADIEELKQLQQSYPQIQVCMGWHPWMISPSSSETITKTCSLIASYIEETSTPIGEIGLDLHPRWKHTLEQQKQVLEYFFDLAIQTQRPVVLHVVRAHHEILRYLKSYSSLKIYLHDFRGSIDVVRQYLKYDVFFGFSVLNSGLQYNKLLRVIPSERVLLESDGLLSLSEFQNLCNHDYFSSLLPIHHSNFSQFCQ